MTISPNGRPARPATPRLAPVSNPSDEVEDILAGGLKSPAGAPLNIFGTMAHHPKLLKRFLVYAGYFLNRGIIPAREREIVVLRVGAKTSSVYEFGQHTLIGRRCGLGDSEIAALAGDPGDHPWSARDRALIDMVDDLCAHDVVGDATWAALRGDWSDAELCELVLLAGNYRMVAGFLNTMGVQLDPDTPGWPD